MRNELDIWSCPVVVIAVSTLVHNVRITWRWSWRWARSALNGVREALQISEVILQVPLQAMSFAVVWHPQLMAEEHH